MKAILFWATLLIGHLGFAEDVELTLRTDKTAYRLGEKVVFKFAFTNQSDKTRTFFPDPETYYPTLLEFYGAGPKAEEFSVGERSMDYKNWSKDAVVLKPKQSHVWRLEAELRSGIPTEWRPYASSEWQENSSDMPCLIFPGSAIRLPRFGQYDVKAKYELDQTYPIVRFLRDARALWFGRLESHPIKIEFRK